MTAKKLFKLKKSVFHILNFKEIILQNTSRLSLLYSQESIL